MIALFLHAIRLFHRHRLLAAYLIVAAIYIALLAAFPDAPAAILAPFVVYSDPVMVGLLFAGVITLLEREWGTPEQLRVSGIAPPYIRIVRTTAFLVPAIVTSVIIAVGSALVVDPISHFRIAPLSVSIVGGSVTASVVGIVIAERARNSNHFFVLLVVPIIICAVPILSFVPRFQSAIWIFVPWWGPLRLAVDAVVLELGAPGRLTFGSPGGGAAYANTVVWTVVAIAVAFRLPRRFDA